MGGEAVKLGVDLKPDRTTAASGQVGLVRDCFGIRWLRRWEPAWTAMDLDESLQRLRPEAAQLLLD